MEVTVLMIGDWVQIAHPVAPIVPREIKFDKVTGVQMEWIYAINRYGKEESYLQSYVTPIPLTEDILKLNGFIETEYGYSYGDFCLYFYKDGFAVCFSDKRIQISYVHELQHALRLCGLNELADNFKIQ